VSAFVAAPAAGGARRSGAGCVRAGGPAERLELRVEVEPRWSYTLPRGSSMDGLAPVRGGVLHRLVHIEGDAVHVRVAQLASGRVLFGARAAFRAHAAVAIERMRRALGVDLDLRPFHERFRGDPLIGRALRDAPGLRVRGRPDPFEALIWAITEQLIEYERAVAIQRRLIAALGRRCATSGLRDSPPPPALAAEAPARLQSFDLSGGRAIAVVRAAREVAAGRVDLEHPDHDRGWRRLRAIPGIGDWTIEMLALTGQGRVDQLPAGDLSFLKLVGTLQGGDPRHRASEQEVRELFAPYEPWRGLAGLYALRAGGRLKTAITGR
jgi:3-methyladenine DNA glycosylase/8-oxoguanine DNA glycosylase